MTILPLRQIDGKFSVKFVRFTENEDFARFFKYFLRKGLVIYRQKWYVVSNKGACWDTSNNFFFPGLCY